MTYMIVCVETKPARPGRNLRRHSQHTAPPDCLAAGAQPTVSPAAEFGVVLESLPDPNGGVSRIAVAGPLLI